MRGVRDYSREGEGTVGIDLQERRIRRGFLQLSCAGGTVLEIWPLITEIFGINIGNQSSVFFAFTQPIKKRKATADRLLALPPLWNLAAS